MFPALAGGKKVDRRRDTPAQRLQALTALEEHQRAVLRAPWEEKAALARMDRPAIREPLRPDHGQRNAYIQLFQCSEGDAAAADLLLKKHNTHKRSIDIVGLLPECGRAIAKYEKVLAVQEEEDREFDELVKKPLLANRFRRPDPEIMRPRISGVATSATRTKYAGATANLRQIQKEGRERRLAAAREAARQQAENDELKMYSY